MPTTVTDTRQHILDTAEALMAHKGYSAVGLTEVLSRAGVPKGSFYHWFASKEEFGEALMLSYFTAYLATMDRIAGRADATGADQLQEYWQRFHDLQVADDGQGRCLVVKLAAEVADLSEPMRRQLVEGTAGIVERLARMISAGRADESVAVDEDPSLLAEDLYQAWIGASVMAKIRRSPEPLDRVQERTLARLHL